jgi:Uma2 family endonuclease
MAATLPITTAQQLLEAEGLGRCELVRGELVMMSPSGLEHARIVSRIDARLSHFVEQRNLGIEITSDPGFSVPVAEIFAS